MDTAIKCSQSIEIANDGRNDNAALWLTTLLEKTLIAQDSIMIYNNAIGRLRFLFLCLLL